MTAFKRIGLAGAVALTLLAASGGASAAPAEEPGRIVGPNECVECHKVTGKVWQATHHYATFTEMPRSKEARAIAGKLGIRRVKADSLCLGCHFTVQTKDHAADVIAGVSCEACHGAAGGWLKRHSGYSGKKKGEETPGEVALRWSDAEAAGMIRPRMTYRLAKNCLSCHITPREALVNRGGHTPGSPFELVSWLQGEVRHNVWYTDGKENSEASPQR